MRPLPQVGNREPCVPEGGTIGSDLPIVVLSDGERRDKPARSASDLVRIVDTYAVDEPVYVMLRCDGRSVRLPATGFGFDGRELHVYAEVEP